jgi:DNA ligase (NAD+)
MATTKKKIEEMVKKLHAASVAYYETGEPIMTDDEYDSLLEDLQKASPNHPYLQEVGATPGSSVVALPVPMPSLDKRKPDTLRQDDLTKGPYVLMDKLDGISALWVCGYNKKPALLLRGNGVEGQDVSHCISGIQGLKQCGSPSVMVRGELIVPKGVIEGTLARNWVNGQLHQKAPSKEDLNKVRFVAYQVCEPRTLTRSQQITWLMSQGFEVAWTRVADTLNVDALKQVFQERRQQSMYECDGLVVGSDCIPMLTGTSNPKDAYAFKMPLDDQRAVSTVLNVEWASSRTGNWIPRIHFEPVKIGTATIEYCTGFNGQFIKDNTLGPGAKITVRRSGDVIPVCENVLIPCASGWQEPPQGLWKWDGTGVHCVDTSTEASPEKLALELAHQLVTLGVEGISKVSTKKLVEEGIVSLKDLLEAPVKSVQGILGGVNGEKLKVGLNTAVKSATEAQWIRAFLGWPKGFGESKITETLKLEADVSKWSALGAPPKGQTMSTFLEIQKAVPAYLAWRSTFPRAAAPVMLSSVQTIVPTKGTYVISGFRDAALQQDLAAKGWVVQDRVTKTTNYLLVPDDAKETTKVAQARAAGVQIVTRSNVKGVF